MSAHLVSVQRIEATLATLADLTKEDHKELDDTTRTAITRVRVALHDIRDRKLEA